MLIQIVSDLHLEFWDKKPEKTNFITPSAPILALLGDICCCADVADIAIYERFLMRTAPNFLYVIIVAGNHEYYVNEQRKISNADSIDGINQKIEQMCDRCIKTIQSAGGKTLAIKYLQNKAFQMKVKDQVFIFAGSTLWTTIPKEKCELILQSMSDYEHIYVRDGAKTRLLQPRDVNEMNLTAKKFILRQISRAKKIKANLILLTHHKPYKNLKETPLTCAYENDLNWNGSPIVLWGYGHTHLSDNTTINSTIFFSNPKGYPYQKTRFSKNAKISI